MSVKVEAAGILNLRAGETRMFLGLFIYSFLIGLIRIYCSTSAMTIFLEKYGAEHLYAVYIISAAFNIAIGTIYVKTSKYLSKISLAIGNISFIFIMTIIVRIALEFTEVKWPAMLVAIWAVIVTNMAALAFWDIASKMLDVRQGKRLFSVIGTGDTLASILGGISISFLVEFTGVSNLLSLSGAAAFLTLIHIHCSFKDKRLRQKSLSTSSDRKSYQKFFRSPYILIIMLYIAFVILGLTFLDNAFNHAVQNLFADPKKLAKFLGAFFAITQALTFLFQFFVASSFVNRYGLIAGLIILPVMTLFGSLMTVASGSILGSGELVLWFVVATQFFKKILADTQFAQLPILYQPLKKGTSVQMAVSSIFIPLVAGVSGLFLMLLNSFFSMEALELSYFCIVFSIAWIIVGIFLNEEYVRTLAKALSGRRMKQTKLSLEDGAVIALLEKELESPFPENAIYALDLLETAKSDSLPDIFGRFLNHPSEDIRKNILERIEKHRFSELLGPVKLVMNTDKSLAVRAAALGLICALSEEDIELGIRHLGHDSRRIRIGAFSGLLKSGSIEGIVYAGSELIKALRSSDAAERKFAADVMGKAAIAEFHRPMLKLLRDPDFEVRKAALSAASKLKSPLLWPAVIENLGVNELSSVAVSCLIEGGSSVIGSLTAKFQQSLNSERALVRIIRIAGMIRGKEALEFLSGKVKFENKNVRHAVIMGLKNCEYRTSGDGIYAIVESVRNEAREAAWSFSALKDFEKEGDDALLLKQSLEYEIDRNRDRIFILLSFVHDRKTILQIWNNYSYGDREKKSYALELLDNTISINMKDLIFPILDDLRIDERIDKLKKLLPQTNLGATERARQILNETHECIATWTKCCVLYWAGKRQTRELTKAVAASLKPAAESLARETAIWTLTRLKPENLEELLPPLTKDKSERIASQARLALEKRPLQLTLEKVLYLKSVEMFAQVYENVLADLVFHLEEIEFSAERTIFEKGDAGDCMYIVTHGHVRIHDGEVVIKILGPRQIFGEFTILSSGPRSASATTVGAARLLRLPHDVLYKLLSENLDAGKGLIHVLCDKLRDQ